MADRCQVPLFDWAERPVLVTGADGFVGRWLVRALADRGACVAALVRRPRAAAADLTTHAGGNVTFVEGNVADAECIASTMRRFRIGTVFHLAGINVNRGSVVEPRLFFDAHVHGACSVLDACRMAANQCTVVLASSREVEDCLRPDCPRAMHPYMASKAAAELIARAYHDTYEIPVVVLRSQNIYGGGDRNWQRLVPGTIRSLLHGERPVIRGTGLLRRDYVYVADAVDAYLAAAESARRAEVGGKVFRIASGAAVEVRELVALLAEVAGRADLEPVVLGGLPEDRVDEPYVPDEERAVLGWSARTALREGLARTVEWYATNFPDGGAFAAE